MALKIYTKTGDLGKTSLLGGSKVPKSHIRIESYGTIDELNSHIGLISDYISDDFSKTILKEVQDRLFTAGSSLACDPDKDNLMKIPEFKESDIAFLEEGIDKMNMVLPVMNNFILPGGHVAVSAIHIARCVCRRAERICVSMQEKEMYVDPFVIKYLNRLSDYLFVLARYTGYLLKIPEVAWKPRT